MQCDECGKDFRPKTTWQHFCSPKCRSDHNNREFRRAQQEAKREAYAEQVAAHEAKMNGHSTEVSTEKKPLDLVALKLAKPKPALLRRMI